MSAATDWKQRPAHARKMLERPMFQREGIIASEGPLGRCSHPVAEVTDSGNLALNPATIHELHVPAFVRWLVETYDLKETLCE